MRVMIDIETLATRNDAAIVQIGAVAFDDTGILHEPFLVSIEREFYEAEKEAFYVDPETVAWWAKQGKAARDSLNINKVSTVYIALDRMVEWFEKIGYDPKNDEVWANPPQFDLAIIRYAASVAYGHDNNVPWKHWNERDCRTLRCLTREIKLGADGAELIKHRADHDAIRQALIVNKQLGEL